MRQWTDDRVPPEYEVHELGRSSAVSVDDVLALWAREGAVDPDVAARRVHEGLLAVTAGGELLGVSTAYLQRNAQLRIDLWYYRVFVAASHRKSSVGVLLGLRAWDVLLERFLAGDRRGLGMGFEVEHAGVRRELTEAVWQPHGTTFIGINPRGDHVRVLYFPGVHVPTP